MNGWSRLQRTLTDALAGTIAQPHKPVHVPEAGRLMWDIFIALNRTRTYHGAGPNPISHAEIEAYARLYRWPLEPRHVDLILSLDRVWLDHAHRQQRLRAENQPSANDPTLDRGAFDAVFG